MSDAPDDKTLQAVHTILSAAWKMLPEPKDVTDFVQSVLVAIASIGRDLGQEDVSLSFATVLAMIEPDREKCAAMLRFSYAAADRAGVHDVPVEPEQGRN